MLSFIDFVYREPIVHLQFTLVRHITVVCRIIYVKSVRVLSLSISLSSSSPLPLLSPLPVPFSLSLAPTTAFRQINIVVPGC